MSGVLEATDISLPSLCSVCKERPLELFFNGARMCRNCDWPETLHHNGEDEGE